MEGCLNLTGGDTLGTINQWITDIKESLPKDFKFVYVGGQYMDGYDFTIFTHICPMLYTNEKFYQIGNTNIIDEYLNSWTDKEKGNIPKNKIILTFQAQSAAGGDQPRTDGNILKGNNFINILTKKLNTEGYAGLLGWAPVYPEGEQGKVQSQSDADMCLRLINSVLKRQPNPNPPKPPPKPKPKPPSGCKHSGNTCGLFLGECCSPLKCDFGLGGPVGSCK